jgi:sporulation protein YlmC with PRC-barrel domain
MKAAGAHCVALLARSANRGVNSMRNLMMTAALVFPLAAVPAFGQEAPPPAAGEAPVAPAEAPGAGAGGDAAAPGGGEAPAEAAPPGGAPAEGLPEEDAMGETPEEGAPMQDAPEDVAPVGEPTDVSPEAAPEDAAEPAGEDAAEGEEAAAGPAPDAVVTEMAPSEVRADWIIGTSVTSPDDETIGSIEDVILDQEEGRVTAAILGVGGFLGIGAKNIAVDWDELQIDHDGREITLDLTREEAENAPEYAFRDQAEAPAPMAPAGGDAPLGGGAPAGGDPAAPPPTQ